MLWAKTMPTIRLTSCLSKQCPASSKEVFCEKRRHLHLLSSVFIKHLVMNLDIFELFAALNQSVTTIRESAHNSHPCPFCFNLVNKYPAVAQRTNNSTRRYPNYNEPTHSSANWAEVIRYEAYLPVVQRTKPFLFRKQLTMYRKQHSN